MKTLLVLIALSLPTMSSAAEYLHVECYLAEGTSVIKTFDNYIFGSVKTTGNRVIVEGQTVSAFYERRTNTPDTCRSAREWQDSDNSGSGYYADVDNVRVFAMGFTTVDLSCALGSVVKRYGAKDNFIKAHSPRATQAPSSTKPYCLDFTELQ